MADEFDVVIVGSGPAGCSAAMMFGRQGARVALLEAHRDPNHFKRLCTHSIRSSAGPTLKRLKLDTVLVGLGAVRHHEKAWTKRGWIHESTDIAHGFNIRRVTLDPVLRSTAAAAPGVELMMGAKVRELTTDGNGRVNGVVAEMGGDRVQIGSRLVVGADGYTSKVAELAGLPGRVSPNMRFAYQAGYRNLGLPQGWSGAGWLQEPDVCYFFNNNDGVTMLAAFVSKERLSEFREDREAALLRAFDGLPHGPDLSGAERVTDVIGTPDYPSITRRHIVRPGAALVGDAAMVGDPLWGTGCGWAFQSAEWLADAVAESVVSGSAERIDACARRYERKHHMKLFPHQFTNIRFSRRPTLDPLLRLVYTAAPRDRKVAQRFAAIGTRNSSPVMMLDPILLARAAIASRRPLIFEPQSL